MLAVSASDSLNAPKLTTQQTCALMDDLLWMESPEEQTVGLCLEEPPFFSSRPPPLLTFKNKNQMLK